MPNRRIPKRLFRVRLMRPVYQTALVDVKAHTEEAEALALARARRLPEAKWQGEHDRRDGLDAQAVYDAAEMEEIAEDDAEILDMMNAEGPDETVRYALFKADVGTGEGKLVVPPWLREASPLMQADLCGDWQVDLQVIEEKGTRDEYEELERVAAETRADKKPPGERREAILPFRPRREEPDSTDKPSE